MRSITFGLALTVIVLQLASPVRASTGQANLLDLARHAKFAVIGVVADRFSVCPTEGGHIFTYITFSKVKTLLKEGGPAAKDAPEQITLRIPGGMVDGRVEILTDAPIFRAGEEIMLFLTRDPQQQVPIVHGSNGVLLIEDGKLIRSYAGPYVTKVGKNFEVQLDPAYKPDPKYLRHWDPNMVAAWKPAGESKGLGRSPSPVIVGEPMRLKEFTRHLERAWEAADKMGRLPKELDYSPIRPYGEIPSAQRPQ